MMDAIHKSLPSPLKFVIKSKTPPPSIQTKSSPKITSLLRYIAPLRVFIILHAGIDLAGSIPLKKSLCFEKYIYIPKVT